MFVSPFSAHRHNRQCQLAVTCLRVKRMCACLYGYCARHCCYMCIWLMWSGVTQGIFFGHMFWSVSHEEILGFSPCCANLPIIVVRFDNSPTWQVVLLHACQNKEHVLFSVLFCISYTRAFALKQCWWVKKVFIYWQNKNNLGWNTLMFIFVGVFTKSI